MKAGDVMTTGAATVSAEAPLAEAARLLVEHRISGLPVVDSGGALVGIVTEHDFLETGDGKPPRWLDGLVAGDSGQASLRDLQERRVADVMSKDPLSVKAATPVAELLELMQRKRVKRLPVVNEGKVIGIVSRASLLEALVRKMDQPGSILA